MCQNPMVLIRFIKVHTHVHACCIFNPVNESRLWFKQQVQDIIIVIFKSTCALYKVYIYIKPGLTHNWHASCDMLALSM
jgi:hypothetical protein